MPIMLDKPIVSENALSVSEISERIKACMDSPYFKGLEIFGEVSGFKVTGPHAYFTLKDDEAQIPCTLFQYQYKASEFLKENGRLPKDGDSLILRGGLDYFAKGGRLNFNVSSLTLNGKGNLFLQFEKLKAKLLAEGLFDEAHKKAIPLYAKNVLVLTSKTGAVIRDIVTTIRRKNPIINIVVRDVRVQGDGAGKEIARVLPIVDELNYDVIIIARGGGSLEDLAPFYDEDLCRAVYNLKTPVISAVGHETDFSLCDFVADARAATPTAAGELVAYDYYEMVQELSVCMDQMKKYVKSNFENSLRRVELNAVKIQRLATSFYEDKIHRVEKDLEKIKNTVDKKYNDLEQKTLKAVALLDSLSPLKTLSRGYFSVQKAGKTIPKVKDLKVGDDISIKGQDGSVDAKITNIIIEE